MTLQTPSLRTTLATGLAALAPLFAGSVAGAAQAADGKLAVKAGRVVTMAGEELENGTILIEDGRITAVGTDVSVPWDAVVLEYPDMVAMPGFVEAHTSSGMDRPNEGLDVAPFLNVRDSIDPVNFYFQNALRWGVTTINVQQGNDCVIGAQGMVVRPWGMTVEQMMVRPGSGLKMSVDPKRGKSRATQAQVLRTAFGDLRRYLEDLVQEKKDGRDTARREALYQGRDLEGEKAKGRAMKSSGWAVEGLELVPRGEIDEKQEPLLDLVEGRTGAFVYCGSPMDVHTALSIAKENGFLGRTTLVLAPSCWKAADAIKEAGVPVVLSDQLVHSERDPLTGEETETFVPGVFREKGIPFALQSADDSTRSLWYQVARCVGHGMPRAEALAAATTSPAQILGLEDRVGSLAAGKDGNVVLYSGDPLAATSLVEHVVLAGEHVYDRSQDVRAKHLLEGQEPENTAPAEEDDGGDAIHADERGER